MKERKAKSPEIGFKGIGDKLYEWTEGRICLDTNTDSVRVIKRLKWEEEIPDINEDDTQYHRAISEIDITSIRRNFSAQGVNVTKEDIWDCLYYVASKNPVNHIQTYIEQFETHLFEPENLAIDTWLIDYCGASGPHIDIIKAVGRKFLVGMVKRGLFPGSRMESMLILEGEQGIGKSSLCRILSGADRGHPEFYCDELVDLKNAQKVIETYAGCLIVEIGELDAFSAAGEKTLKRFIVKTRDVARKAFGRLTSDIPRTFSFIGTTNEYTFLRDETGNRRHWPLIVERIDLDGLTEAMPRLMAEAYYLVKYDLEEPFLSKEEEKLYDQYRKTKLHATETPELKDFILDNYEHIFTFLADEHGLIESDKLLRHLKSNEIKYSNQEFGLTMVKLGAKRLRKRNGNFWQLLPLPNGEFEEMFTDENANVEDNFEKTSYTPSKLLQ